MLSGVFICLLFGTASAKQGFGPTDQDWGYVTVRENAHTFWWLHYTTANVSKYTETPLIVWLQGGPGGSSTGYGNFMEFGPLDTHLKPRNNSWVKWANILFVDTPVGSGFSYVDDPKALATNNSEIAQDFLVFLKSFYEQLPEFKKVPLYIFCESYGGKIAAEMALVIDQARKNKVIESNLQGIALGDSWISPVDLIMTYAPYLLNLGEIDKDGYNQVMKVANKIKCALNNKNPGKAESLWHSITSEVEMVTDGVSFYNVLEKIQSIEDTKTKYRSMLGITENEQYLLYNIMNNKVRLALNISQEWLYQNNDVLNALAKDFMLPVINIVEKLLNDTDIKVTVYNGDLDLIVDTPGTIKWVERLNFVGKKSWDDAPRNGFIVNGFYEGYEKKSDKFSFYWVQRSGHMVPNDNPAAMHYILKEVTNNFKV